MPNSGRCRFCTKQPSGAADSVRRVLSFHERVAVLRVEPYLYFQGRCEEALKFYQTALGADVEILSRFGEGPGAQGPPDSGGKVAHAVIRIGESVVLASDGQGDNEAVFQGFSLSITAADDEEAERTFAALADGGTVQVPLMSTPFASRLGLLADRFEVPWTIVTQP
jgi:PhnB protein